MAEKQGKPNKVDWYFLAVIFGFIGGIVGYFALRNKDKKLARNVLIVGIVATIIFWFIGYLYITGLFVSSAG